jgi:hypothetical protein
MNNRNLAKITRNFAEQFDKSVDFEILHHNAHCYDLGVRCGRKISVEGVES